ncbi:MAG: glycosyltransferase [Selenomonadaceae bacterium]|nr:glycosyltransferase [Selenomonadaceae bacterium]
MLSSQCGKQVALCIPTYQNSKCVEDFFDNCLSYYLECSLDIYFFDSSADDATQQVVQAQIQLHPERIFYVRWDVTIHSNAKVYHILQGLDYPMHRYQYVWFCSDAVQYTASALGKLMAVIDKAYDVICFDPTDCEGLGCHEYLDCEHFFRDCAWVMTLYGTAVLRTKTTLTDVDWKKIEHLCLNNPSIINFSHVTFIFRRILQIKHPGLYHLSLGSNEFRSSVRKKTSLWRLHLTFQIFCSQWVKAMASLPYDKEAIQAATLKMGKYSVFASSDKFVVMRLDGIYSLREFLQYLSIWPSVCTVPRHALLRIALTPRWYYRYRYAQKRQRMLRMLQDFCQGASKIVIYGLGRTGIIYSDFLDRRGVRYAGYCVTRKGVQEFRGYPVWSFAELQSQSGVGFLLAMAETNAAEVMTMLQQQGVQHYLFSKELYDFVCYEMGYRG